MVLVLRFGKVAYVSPSCLSSNHVGRSIAMIASKDRVDFDYFRCSEDWKDDRFLARSRELHGLPLRQDDDDVLYDAGWCGFNSLAVCVSS